MAGRIRDEDIAEVRAKTPIDEIIGEHVQLRNAGGGNLKGICPFHDEKSPSLSVSPARGLFHCFGCGAGGDVIRFVERIEHLSFSESVEQLAARAGIQLRYLEGSTGGKPSRGQHTRLIEAHAAAAKFYAEQLRTPEAAPARAFLAERGFDDAAASTYGCGFAPGGWDSLTKHLQAQGFTSAELTAGGLARESQRGSLIDRFHRRLLWPIRDVGGSVVGFGARRLFDDDKIEAKYVNSPETPIYKKSQLLYGMDLARKEIARQHRAVIVEGYTDVMACHLAGVQTAVATCGTAFGSEHIGVLRRLLMDSDAYTGEVIFTFDGDAAGQKAAERAFSDDQKFMSQTFIAVEPNGKDPCELRQSAGDAAVRDLVARRVPLVEFVLRQTVSRFDLDTAEGRSRALDLGVPLVAQIKDTGLRVEYSQSLARMIGVDDPDRVLTRVREDVRRRMSAGSGGQSNAGPGGRGAEPRRDRGGSGQPAQSPAAVQTQQRSAEPVVDEQVAFVEREVLKVALQLPGVAGPTFDSLPEDAFMVLAHRQLRSAIAASGGTAEAVSGPGWAGVIESGLPDDRARTIVHALAVEPLHSGRDSQERYAAAVMARLQEMAISRRVAALKSKLQRINPVDAAEEHTRLFGELISLESQRRAMRERAIGDE
ncbi:DNA primase [Jatrophihabitans sp. GAS493]|uniref:DNA primase n=1 Tax=Jatrophihabitans sp. GAS493 TaxID=1907575 RepID=UPI000BB882B5|nr:DNA primase [Jatrophihabitans sp. GAS493]SOD74691.1 DNA primase [Jatrophihabitans sp. GAS493]